MSRKWGVFFLALILCASFSIPVCAQQQPYVYNALPLEMSYINNGEFHKVVVINHAFSVLEGSVELEDGSIWTVWYEDMYKTTNWLSHHTIVISKNDAFFSSYDFKITNLDTGSSLLANLYLGPFYQSVFRNWITDIYDNMIYLSNGTVWSMSYFDLSTIYNWNVGDTIIIGVTDGLLNPNFLLNVETMTKASGKAYN